MLRGDLLAESALEVVRQTPWRALWFPVWLIRGKAYLKRRIAELARPDFEALPLNRALVEWLRGEKARGRVLYLASASDRALVEGLSTRVGLFDGVFASDGTVNLAGAAKRDALRAAFGERRFDYVGDDAADLPVWASARRAYAVEVSPRVRARLDAIGFVALPADPRPSWRYLVALRPWQWLKNLLVFVAPVAGHVTNAGAWGSAALAFGAFCACASAVYIINDLLDLASDRAHPRKRERVFASGAVPVAHGLVLAGVALAIAAALALPLGAGFLAVLVLYLVLTTAYSLRLKRIALVDLITLAGLYTLRVLAGAAAVSVPVSEWLLAFSMFMFLALAVVKRHAELVDAAGGGRGAPTGRGYREADLPVLGALGIAAAHSGVLVFALYLSSPQVQSLYSSPGYLWGICVLLYYWLARMIVFSHRGVMHDDPLVFAVRDHASLGTGAACAVLFLLAV